MYLISYITTNGSLVLNNIVKADTMGQALIEVRENDDIQFILSIISF